MVGSDLEARDYTAVDVAVDSGDYPVTLANPDDASGLADMLHQYLAQNVSEFPRKVSQARGLRGEVVFRAAEDENVCVRMIFSGEKIHLLDSSLEGSNAPAMTTDFISVAHLTTGEESPFALLFKRKMKVRFSLRDAPFLVGVLRFMQIPEELQETQPMATWKWVAIGAGAAAAAGGSWWYLDQLM